MCEYQRLLECPSHINAIECLRLVLQLKYSPADKALQEKVLVCISSLRTQILAQKYVAGHYFCPVKHIISTTSAKTSNIQ